MDIIVNFRVNMILDHKNNETKNAKDTKNKKKLFHFEIFTKNSNFPLTQESLAGRFPSDKTNNIDIIIPSEQSIITSKCEIGKGMNNGKNENAVHARKKIINKDYLMPSPIKNKHEKLGSKNTWTKYSNLQLKQHDKSNSPGILF